MNTDPNTPAQPSYPACSAKVAALLYAQLEYYREHMPSLLRWTEERYAATQEAKNTDEALEAYRQETGVSPTYTSIGGPYVSIRTDKEP